MMRRKSARNSRKSPEKSNTDLKKNESPKKVTRSSRRRKRSSSKSDNESENGTVDIIQEQPDKIETTEEFQVNSENDEESTRSIEQSVENIESNLEEVAEENIEKEEDKGKSKGINNTQTEQSWNNIETENEHVQGTPQSPSKVNAVTESVQNIKEECTQNEEIANKEENDFQSEYVEDTNVHNKDSIEQPQSNPNDMKKRSSTPEMVIKTEEKKKIILRRITVENPEKLVKEQPVRQEEAKRNNDDEEKKISRKIILKRHTTEPKINDDQKEENTSIEDINIERKGSAHDAEGSIKEEKIDKPNEGIIEVTPQETEVTKPSMKIKLIRNFSQEQNTESVDNFEPKLRRKQNWGGSTEWLDNVSAVAFQIDVESIKGVCSVVEFLEEEDVKLESEPPKERFQLEVELPRRRKLTDGNDDTGEMNSSEDVSSDIDHLMSHRKITIVKSVSEVSVDSRIPSPAKNSPSDVLFIANLVRPFTVKQLRELLERTGTIVEDGFWTDRIKSKCFVRYQTVEQAETTRNALHGVNWPVGNGKKLDIDFATVEDLEKAKNPAPPKIVPEVVPEKENMEPEKELKLRAPDIDEKFTGRKREGPVREWDKGKGDMRRRSRSRSVSRERVRKHNRLSFTPEVPAHPKRQKRSEEPVAQKLMDDLFLKTKATPSIYWQPLSPEEIARKQHQRLVRMEEHKRRIEENRERLRENRRAPYRRR